MGDDKSQRVRFHYLLRFFAALGMKAGEFRRSF